MIYSIDNQEYKVIINKKNNKNTYIKINDEGNIVVTTNFWTPKFYIKSLLANNEKQILKMLEKKQKSLRKKKDFYFLGQKYDIIIDSKLLDLLVEKDKITVSSLKKLDAWYNSKMKIIFNDELKKNYELFTEDIPYPSLKIRQMKTRWGVCNVKTKVVTLNALLLKEKTEVIDYVIIHELAHLVYPNHSKAFWQLVGKYCSDYKLLRKQLKE
ncbi:MAG: SprT family zinc-dependent metalloprotease [Bacilli bacterium]|nr:SprT family zinc-dependent metalloprotease [Bacilli bacterium]